MHGKQGCIKLQSKFVCFADVEKAKALIKRFRAEGYTFHDSVNRLEQQRTPIVACHTQSVP